jgi:hypothetical protein
VSVVPIRSKILLFAVLAALTAGCSTSGDAEEEASPTTTASSAAATPTPSTAIRSMRPVAKVSSACRLLSAAELKELLGGSASSTKVAAKEDKPDPAGGFVTYTCEYGSDGNYPFALSTQGVVQKGVTPKMSIDAVAEAAKVKTRRVSGVGSAAVYYTLKNGISVLAAVKRSHGENRLATFAAPKVVPGRKFIEVVKLVMSRM